jgi:carbamoyl-phosphate synthase large subunit
MQSKQIHVLMTGAGAPGAAGILNCLHRDPSIKVTVADADDSAVGRYLNESFIQIPHATDPSFCDFLLINSHELKIDFILPLVTKELLPLALNKALFAQQGIKVLVSSAAAIKIANDKGKTYDVLKEANLPVPLYKVVSNIDEFKATVTSELFKGKTVCFKPTMANGSRGFRIISDNIDQHDLLFNYKPNNTFIHLDQAIAILSSKPFPPLLVSEYLPGDEYSVDCLADEGTAKLIVPRVRNKMVNGISVKGSFVNDSEIISYCKSIIQVLQLHGNIGIQVKRDAEGKALLLEINPRVQGTISSALGAGINLPLLAIKQELGIPITPGELTVNWSTSFSRYWSEVFY